MLNKQKQVQVVLRQDGRMSTQGQPAVTTVTAAVSGPVSSNAMASATASASVLPPMSSSTIVTTVSSAIASMAVAVQVENLPRSVCSEMGISQLPNSICGTEETITPVPEDFARGVTSVTGTLLEEATLYGQSSGGPAFRLTDAQNTIMVTMLGDALQTVNVGMQGSYTISRTNYSVFQSLLQHI